MQYKVKLTTKFKKDLKLAQKQHRNIERLKVVVDILKSGNKLPPEYDDHQLKGTYSHARECHIENNWVLVYEYDDDVLILSLLRLGTHSQVFKSNY